MWCISLGVFVSRVSFIYGLKGFYTVQEESEVFQTLETNKHGRFESRAVRC